MAAVKVDVATTLKTALGGGRERHSVTEAAVRVAGAMTLKSVLGGGGGGGG